MPIMKFRLIMIVGILISSAPAAAFVEDPGFDEWEKQYVQVEPFLDLTDEDFLQKTQDLDAILRTYLFLKSSDAKVRAQGITAAAGVMDELGTGEAKTLALSPILSHMLFAYVETSEGTQPYKKLAGEFLDVIGAKTCPYKNYVDYRLVKQTPDQEELMQLLRVIADYRSERARQKSLSNFITKLPQEHRQTFLKDLQLLTRDFPKLAAENTWLKAEAADDKLIDPKSGIREQLKRGKCKEATSAAKALGLPPASTLQQSLELYDEIGRCYRRFNIKDRIDYWESLRGDAVKRYGWQADALFLKRISQSYWTIDMFDEANSNIVKAIDMTSEKLRAEAANADSNSQELLMELYYHQVLVLENQGNVDAALATLEKLEQINGRQPSIVFDALRIHALLLLEKEEWQQASRILTRLIKDQDALEDDKKDLSFLGFGLFWQGYADFKLKETLLAQRSWRRLVNEYYSTYYGAIGQFMLERAGGKVEDGKDAKPVVRFKAEMISKAFNTEQKLLLDRVLMLLKVGLHDDANCELEELETSITSPEQRAYLSLMFYASGRWFKAIQIYSALPRDLRDTLPQAFEKIVFPRKYDELIFDYAKRLNIDPYLVMALIRQESIFNRFAQSGVGAMGVMQLVNPTALLEVKKMPQSYLKPEEREYIKLRTGKTNWLYDVNVNIPVGIHHLFRLLEEKGSVVFSLAGYNAGSSPVKRWQEVLPVENLPLFVERIPYQETRNYVKLIFRNYYYYKRLYQKDAGQMPYLEDYFKTILNKTEIN